MNNRAIIFIILSMLPALLSGCASTRSAEEMRDIQQREGFFTKELYYVGSTESYHYFEQVTSEKSMKLYRVPKEQLVFTNVAEMPYRLPDDQVAKVKISSAPPYTLRITQSDREKCIEYKKRIDGLEKRVSNAMMDKINGQPADVKPPPPASTSDKKP